MIFSWISSLFSFIWENLFTTLEWILVLSLLSLIIFSYFYLNRLATTWLITILLAILLGLYAVPLWNYAKYSFFWNPSFEAIEATLEPLFTKDIVEIKGGASSGKSLCLALLMKYLRGRKWTNLINVIPGVVEEELTLPLLTEHRKGIFREQIGITHCLFIDRAWAFFSNYELKEGNFSEAELAELLEFFSEPQRIKYKLFLVSKPNTNRLVDHYLANKSATIETLGIRKYLERRGQKYYYLDLKFNDEKLAIPFMERDLHLFDASAALDPEWSKNRMISIIDILDFDGLVEMTGHRPSRAQQLREQAELAKQSKKGRSRRTGRPPKQKTENDPETATELALDMEAIYAQADQKYSHDTPEWNRFVESLITKAKEEFEEDDSN